MRCNYPFIGFVLVLFVIVSSPFVLSGTAIHGSRGSGTLSPGGTRVDDFSGEVGGIIEGEVILSDGEVFLYILHEDDYDPEDGTINELACIVHERASYHSFSFEVEKAGDWYMILENPCTFDITYNYTIQSIAASEIPIIMISSSFLPGLIVILSILFVGMVRRGPIEKGNKKLESTTLISGLTLLILVFILPFHIEHEYYSESNVTTEIVSVFWTLLIQDGGIEIVLNARTNPFWWISILFIMGPLLMLPFTMVSYYQGRLSFRRTIIIGILTHSFLIFGLISTLLASVSGMVQAFMVPLPVLLFIYLGLLFILPRTKFLENKSVDTIA